jgi:hypothetical protein
MLYIGHFSFSFDTKVPRKAAQPWHGYFTTVAEAPNAEAALRKLDLLVRTAAASSELFSDVTEIFLESCIELKSVPRAGFLAHVALEEGESLGSISSTLPGLAQKYAVSYHLEPDSVDEDGGFDALPFIVFDKKGSAAKAGAKKGSRTKGAASKTAGTSAATGADASPTTPAKKPATKSAKK